MLKDGKTTVFISIKPIDYLDMIIEEICRLLKKTPVFSHRLAKKH